MMNTDFHTVNNCKYTIDVNYSLRLGSSVGRVANGYAKCRFAWGEFFRSGYCTTFGFDTIDAALDCKKAIENKFADKDVKVGNITDTYMKKVAAEIDCIEKGII